MYIRLYQKESDLNGNNESWKFNCWIYNYWNLI
jgi:hypothetical protein